MVAGVKSQYCGVVDKSKSESIIRPERKCDRIYLV